MSGILLNPFMVQAAAGGGPTVPGAPTLAWVRDWSSTWSTKWGEGTDLWWDWQITAPADTGGSAIDLYQFKSFTRYQTGTDVPSGGVFTMPYDSILMNAHVRAHNTTGWSAWSPPLSGFNLGIGVPYFPTFAGGSIGYPLGYSDSGGNRTWTYWPSRFTSYNEPVDYIRINRDGAFLEDITSSYTIPHPADHSYTFQGHTAAGFSYDIALDYPPATAPTLISASGTWRDIYSDYKNNWDNWKTYISWTNPSSFGKVGGVISVYLNDVYYTSVQTMYSAGAWVIVGQGDSGSPVGKTMTLRYRGPDADATGSEVSGVVSNGVVVS